MVPVDRITLATEYDVNKLEDWLKSASERRIKVYMLRTADEVEAQKKIIRQAEQKLMDCNDRYALAHQELAKRNVK